jgi:tripartite ATP-independent transporter DctM subunit
VESIFLLFSLVVLIVLGAPIGFVLAGIPTVYILFTDTAPLVTIPYQMYQALAHVPLVAIPFFMLTGELMNTSTITDRLLDLSRSIIGRLRGGLAQVNILTSMLFAGMNASVVADTATVGAILIPAMKKARYSAEFSAAITAVSSTIGGIIPPSVAMVVLASSANLSVGALFSGGIIPGLLVGLGLMALTYIISVRRNYERSDEPFRVSAVVRSFGRASFALIIPFVLVGGIVGGVFSSVEAGALTALTAFLVGAVIYRSLTPRAVFGAFSRSMKLSASVFIIIAAAGPFSWLLTRLGTLKLVEDWLLGFADTPWLFILVVVAFIFVIGMVMDAVANIIVLGPLLIDICVQAGFAEVQAALVVIVGFLVGTVTPPIGVAYFTATKIADAKAELVAMAMVPFILVEVVVLYIMCIFPDATMWFPKYFGFIN